MSAQQIPRCRAGLTPRARGVAAAGLGAAVLMGMALPASPWVPSAFAASPEALAAGSKQLAGADSGAWSTTWAAAQFGTMPISLDPKGKTPPSVTTEDVPADANGPAGHRTTTTELSSEGSGSRITVRLDLKISEVRGRNRSNTRSRITATLDYCPDPNGKVVAQVDLQASGDNAIVNAAGTGGYSYNLSAKGSATGTVDDQALLARLAVEVSAENSVRGGQNAADAAGKPGNTRKASSGSARLSSGGAVQNSPTRDGPANGSTADFTAGRQLNIGELRGDDPGMTTSLSGMHWNILQAAIESTYQNAQAKWRSGACVEIVVRPPVVAGGKTNTTQPRERKSFEVAVRHKTEKAELPLPLQAALDGRDTLEPKRVDKAAGRFTYVAGGEPKDYGNVALKSVSRRGIAEDRVAFNNRQTLGGPFTAQVASIMQATATGRVSWQAKPGATDTFVPEGTITVQGKRRKCSAHGQAEIGPGDGELLIKRDAQGTPVEYRGHGIKMMALSFKCPGADMEQTLPVAWFGTAEAFRPVAADGSMSGSMEQGGVRWTWQFTR